MFNFFIITKCEQLLLLLSTSFSSMTATLSESLNNDCMKGKYLNALCAVQGFFNNQLLWYFDYGFGMHRMFGFFFHRNRYFGLKTNFPSIYFSLSLFSFFLFFSDKIVTKQRPIPKTRDQPKNQFRFRTWQTLEEHHSRDDMHLTDINKVESDLHKAEAGLKKVKTDLKKVKNDVKKVKTDLKKALDDAAEMNVSLFDQHQMVLNIL